jgi:hypothetical protein
MLRKRRSIAVGLLLVAGLFAPALLAQTSNAPAPATTPHHRTHKTQKPLVLPPLPSGPLHQVPMDQLPSTPAKVSYQNGLLSISAQNSTLGDILREVHTLTGASIDIPQGSAANERVVTSLGPGAPRDVLAGLLNGSSFNYVMLGSNSDPGAVSSVILTTKPFSAGDNPPAVTANVYESNPAPIAPNPVPPQAFNRQLLPPRPGQPANVQAAAADDDDKDDDDKDDDDADDQAKPGQPGQPDPNAAQQQQPDPNQPNAGPKTPEQILQMLRGGQQPGSPMTPQQPPQPPQQQQ